MGMCGSTHSFYYPQAVPFTDYWLTPNVGGPGVPGNAVEEQQHQQQLQMVGCQLWGLALHLPVYKPALASVGIIGSV